MSTNITDLNFKKYYSNQKLGWNYWSSTAGRDLYLSDNIIDCDPTLRKNTCHTGFPDLIKVVKHLQNEFPYALVRLLNKTSKDDYGLRYRTTAWIDIKFFSNGDDAHFGFLYHKRQDGINLLSDLYGGSPTVMPNYGHTSVSWIPCTFTIDTGSLTC